MKTIITILFISLLSFGVHAAGEVDTTFNALVYREFLPGPLVPIRANAVTTTLQPDGKLLVGGVFGVINGIGRNSIVRFNTDGTIDTSFNPPELYDLNNNLNPGNVYAIALQSNGKIIVGGSFGILGSTHRSLIRLNSDGSLDTTFNNLAAQFENTELIYEIVVRPNDAIYATGYIDLISDSGVSTSGVARFDSNGVLDSTFQLPRVNQFYFNIVKAIAVTPDNAVYVSVGTQVSSGVTFRRYNSNGSVDTSFPLINLDAEVFKIFLQPDGKILIGGGFTMINGFTQTGISRITSEGLIDTNFNPSDANAVRGVLYDIDLAADGKIILTGAFASSRNITQIAVVKFNLDGTRDTSFSSPIFSARTASIQNDGKIIISSNNGKLQRFNPDGNTDTSYPQGIFAFSGTVNDIVQQPDGKIVVGGDFTLAGNLTRLNFARFNTDGSLDAGFGTNSFGAFGLVYKMALLPDGKFIVSSSTGVLRVNASGTREENSPPILAVSTKQDLEILADGKILVSGTTRLLPNGAIDNTYSSPNLAGGTILTTFLQPDGKILIGGTFTQVNAVGRGRIARLNADGTLDTTFAPPQGANNNVTDIDLQPDGKIVIIGTFTSLNGDNTKSFIGRLNSDGSLDANFSPTVNSQPLTIKVQPDGKVLIGGTMTIVNGVSRNRYARLNANGTLDTSFIVSSGANGTVNKITLQTDGKILLGGDFSRINNFSAIGIARLLNAPVAARTRFDFDGDGRADVAVFRPSSGSWFILPSQTNAFYGFPFGAITDRIAPADYDGDGKTDVAVFRDTVEGAGDKAYFYILNSADGSFRPVQFGTQNDVPMPGDWDGDGKVDLAVYRAASTAGGQGNFYYRPSSQPIVDFIAIPFGAVGDKPLLGDFDGDGRLDPAVFRPSTATWMILRSSVNQITQTAFGVSTDIPVPADYDGDGAANIAVFRPSNGTWYTSQNPATNFGAIQFGATGDLPVPADYDGDGRADVAVFRPSNGGWYLNRTTSGLAGVQFGANGDKPASNAFIR